MTSNKHTNDTNEYNKSMHALKIYMYKFLMSSKSNLH